MTKSELLTKLEQALDNLVTLEIITAVGPVAPTPRNPAGAHQPAPLATDVKAIRTRINLLQGDIVTEIDPAFVTGEYQELRAFHAEREKQGADIVHANIAALKELLDLFKEHS